eukprot:5871886-Karenia_brevis.AAC.1
MHYFAMALDPTSFTIHAKDYPQVYLFDGPYQLLKPQLQHRAIKARNRFAINRRTVLQGMESVDQIVFNKACRKLTDETDNKIIKYVSSLGAVHEATYDKHSEGVPTKCPYCGDHLATMHHYIWHCEHPTLKQIRSNNNTPQQ